MSCDKNIPPRPPKIDESRGRLDTFLSNRGQVPDDTYFLALSDLSVYATTEAQLAAHPYDESDNAPLSRIGSTLNRNSDRILENLSWLEPILRTIRSSLQVPPPFDPTSWSRAVRCYISARLAAPEIANKLDQTYYQRMYDVPSKWRDLILKIGSNEADLALSAWQTSAGLTETPHQSGLYGEIVRLYKQYVPEHYFGPINARPYDKTAFVGPSDAVYWATSPKIVLSIALPTHVIFLRPPIIVDRDPVQEATNRGLFQLEQQTYNEQQLGKHDRYWFKVDQIRYLVGPNKGQTFPHTLMTQFLAAGGVGYYIRNWNPNSNDINSGGQDPHELFELIQPLIGQDDLRRDIEAFPTYVLERLSADQLNDFFAYSRCVQYIATLLKIRNSTSENSKLCLGDTVMPVEKDDIKFLIRQACSNVVTKGYETRVNDELKPVLENFAKETTAATRSVPETRSIPIIDYVLQELVGVAATKGFVLY